MDTVAIYAIAVGGFFITLFLIRTLSRLSPLRSTMSVAISRHLTYPYFLERHHFLGPWTRASVLLHFSYVAIVAFCLCFRVSNVAGAGRRAGMLAITNMAFPFAGAHLSFIADILGIFLRTCRRIHRTAGWMAGSLLAFHIVVMMLVERTDFPLSHSTNLLALIGAVSFGALLLFSLPLFRRLAYEIFLRTHQGLACLCIYSIWRHLPDHLLPRICIYVPLAVFLLTLVAQFSIILYRNGAFTSRGHPRALVTYYKNGHNDKEISDFIMIRVILSRPLEMSAGQYVNLWMPFVSLWSWAQTHPFMVTSWSQGKQHTLDLFVQPRRGLSVDLSRHARAVGEGSASFLAFISGPHGISEPVDRYESVLVVASGFGIAAVLPYLKKLIYGYNTSVGRTRRIHFVWQLNTLDIAIAAQPLLNALLRDDILDDGYILTISIYVESAEIIGDKMPFGSHERAIVYNGRPDCEKIVQAEVSGEYIDRIHNTQEERGELLVMVSASHTLRDLLQAIVRGYLHEKVSMAELEFQPA